MRQYAADQKCPLDGVRVLDLSRLVAGNQLSLQLADFGAEVVKIEQPGKGDPLRDWRVNGVSAHWKVYGRNKKSVTLNLKHPEGRALLLRLVEEAHVLVESFTPGTMEALGLGPDVLLDRNPGLVIVRISGWGQDGPYAQRPGFGTLVEAMSGFAAMNGFPDREPVLPPLSLADMVAGLYGATATLVALREREVNGGAGQVIDLPLLDPLLSILGPEAAIYQLTGTVKQRTGSRSNTAAPRNVYRTSDGRWLAISASMQVMAERLFRAIGRADLLADPKFRTNADRLTHAAELDAIIAGQVGGRTLADNLAFFDQANVTAAPVYDIAELVQDRHVQEREVIVNLPDKEMGSVPMHNVVPRLQGTPGAIRRPAPELGEHNGEIFGRVGVPEHELARLHAEGII
jgi:crotonobetainyl-CoA:carnitine CoA-transferase CaiB-like acyl-CoA transferase